MKKLSNKKVDQRK